LRPDILIAKSNIPLEGYARRPPQWIFANFKTTRYQFLICAKNET